MSVRRSLCNRENICDVLYDAVGGGMRAEVVRQHLSGALRSEPSQTWVFLTAYRTGSATGSAASGLCWHY